MAGRFDMTGGHPALDLVNTLEARLHARPRERLATYEDLVAWAEQDEILSARIGRGLRRAAATCPRPAAAALCRARRLREALYELFTAAATGRDLPAVSLARFNGMLRMALSTLRLRAVGPAGAWRWSEETALDGMLWPIVRAAADLLTSDRLPRVRLCEADDCAWLFLDSSRNRSRRWCDMTTCGNRSKVRRFREASRR